MKMSATEATQSKPLWLSIEEGILSLDAKDLSGGGEEMIQRLAGELDNSGYNVSRHGGNLMKLRWAVEKARKAGKPMLKDLNGAISGLTLDGLSDLYGAASSLLDNIGKTWPELRSPECRPDVVEMVEAKKLDLMIAKAKEQADDQGIRYLLAEKVEGDVIIESLGITEDKLNEVIDLIKKEKAERDRVAGLLEKVADKGNDEKIKHLFDNEVAEALIIEMAGVDQGEIDAVKKAMEEELKEQQRKAEEEAARKAAEAAGRSLDDISHEDMVDYIDSIREIMEFSDVEKEIRVMCEQSSIPKALVDIAVSDPDKLDELEKNAEG
jgi:uncharacterized protein YaaQ